MGPIEDNVYCPECLGAHAVLENTSRDYEHYKCTHCLFTFVFPNPERNKKVYIIIRDPGDTRYPEFSTRRNLYPLDNAINAAKALAKRYPGAKFFVAKLVKSAVQAPVEPPITIEDVE